MSVRFGFCLNLNESINDAMQFIQAGARETPTFQKAGVGKQLYLS